ncbi:MAG: hypothetical protein JSR59_04225 [Proteobacteria bacterium]|nr:hypothetical protein [Pseudomonadota bacterium]
MTIVQVGLVDTTDALDPQFVQAAAAAFNIQVTRDLPQFWPIQATVIWLPHRHKVPSGVWPVQIVAHLPPDEGGFHLNRHNQPYAKVLATPGSDGWTVAASHEIVEMLIDPSGNRLQSSRSIEIVQGEIQDGPSEFEYLVEACDPCEADSYSYSIQGVVVSDFITPHFYDPQATPGTRYSYTGALESPRQILPGGYISWIDPQSDEWQQLQYLDPNGPPIIQNLGPAEGKSLREWIHTLAPERTGLRDPRALSTEVENRTLFEVSKSRREHLDSIAERRCRSYA